MTDYVLPSGSSRGKAKNVAPIISKHENAVFGIVEKRAGTTNSELYEMQIRAIGQASAAYFGGF